MSTIDSLFAEADIDLERVMHEFAVVAERAKEAYDRKRELGHELAAFAEDKRESQNTVHLTAHDGLTLKCEFKHETTYDPAQMQAVAELLGDQFDSLFKAEIKFVPQKRNLTRFLNTVSTSEAITTAKDLIKEAATDKPLSPYITVEHHAKEKA